MVWLQIVLGINYRFTLPDLQPGPFPKLLQLNPLRTMCIQVSALMMYLSYRRGAGKEREPLC